MLALLLVVVSSSAAALAQMQSTNYSVPRLVANGGSGSRAGQSYQISSDAIAIQPVDRSSSASYVLSGRPLVTFPSNVPSCGLFINADSRWTSTTAVNLSLLCSHPSGCASVQLSNNGVSWSEAFPYSIVKGWTLAANDGERTVFGRFTSTAGSVSGPCSDAILLDTTAPRVSISPTGGTYMSTQSVAISTSEPAAVKYTNDGSDPATSGTGAVYASPLTVASNTTLRAIATDTVGQVSAAVQETYEICTGGGLGISGTVKDATRGDKPMPLVVITLDSGHTATTTPTGTFSFSGLPRGWYNIVSVTTPVPGYVTYQSKLKLCQSSVQHDIVLTKDGTVFGTDTSAGYSGDGVNTSTGNFSTRVADLAIPGRGPSVVFERAYNSQDPTNGPLGYGWTWNYNISLTTGPDGEVVVRWGDGKIEVWAPDGGGGYTPMYGVFSTLIKNPDTSFTLRRKDLIEYRFDVSQRLKSVVDEYGNTIAFGYTGSNLTSITDTSGRPFALSYDASNRITNVLDPIGRSASFTYDGNANLVTATNLGGKTTSYTYDANHQLLKITDPRGNAVATNTYESRRVVSSQRDALGGETRYVYDVPTRTTTITDAMGNTAYHTFDQQMRLVRQVDPLGHAASYVFDARGNMTAATDKNGNVTTYEYDSRGNVLKKTEPLGRITTATYDASNNPVVRTDAMQRSQVFEYDPANGNLLASYDCGGVAAAACTTTAGVKKTTFTYDSATGKLLTTTEAAGTQLARTTTNEYDIAGNRIGVVDALSNRSTFTFDGVGRKVSESHPLGRATAYEYDAMDRLVSVTDALGGMAHFGYDDNGNKTTHTDPLGKATLFTYDAKNRLVSKTDPMGRTESYAYDPLDRRTAVTNARGFTSTVTWDPVGNVIRETDALGGSTRYEYDANGNRIRAWDANGSESGSTYDALNRLTATRDPLGNTETYEYDLNGNRTKVTDAAGKATRSTYDAFNRLLTVTDALGNSSTNTYDLLGRLVRVRDARGSETVFEYDALDRLVKTTDSAGGTVTASYDALGNRTAMVDTRGGTTTYVFDLLNRLVGETDPLANTSLMAYDAVGRLLSLVNADGTTRYQYDDVGRLVEATYPNATTALYTWDANGNRTSVQGAEGTVRFEFDAMDRMSSVTDPHGVTVGYTYDHNGNRSSTRYPGNRSVVYLFDALDRLARVEDWGGVATTYTYDAAGRLASQTMGNGTVVTYGYDDAGRLVSKQDRTAGGTVIAAYTYTLDPNGNRTGMGITQPLLPYVDPLDQTMRHNAGNQMTSNTGVAYTYDGKGNRRTATGATPTTQYGYDFNNRLTSVNDGSHVWQYRYTSDGKRISSVVDGVETRWLLDLSGSMEYVLAEMDADNVMRRYYVYGDGLLYSIDGVTGVHSYYHFDPMGNTVAITDAAAVVTDRYAYLPYGEQAFGSSARDNPFTWVGKLGVMREGNGLFFMRARFYDPESAQFISRDPVRGTLGFPSSLNAYQYGFQNPGVLTDPSGELVPILAAVAAVVVVAWAVHEVVNLYVDSVQLGWSIGKAAAGAEDWSNVAKEAGWFVASGPWLGPVGTFNSAMEGYLPEYEGRQSNCNKTNLVCRLGAWSGRRDWRDRETPSGPFSGGSENAAPTASTSVTVSFGGGGGGARGASSSGSGVRATGEGAAGAPGGTAVGGGRAGAPGESLQILTPLQAAKPPKKFLSVAAFASSYLRREFQLILDPGFLDNQTRSTAEAAIDAQVASLQGHRYGYRTPTQKQKMKLKREQDVADAGGRLYAQMVSAWSKHAVLVRSLAALPAAATGGIAGTGVYSGQ